MALLVGYLLDFATMTALIPAIPLVFELNTCQVLSLFALLMTEPNKTEQSTTSWTTLRLHPDSCAVVLVMAISESFVPQVTGYYPD